jgi:hypothetical protein
VQGLATLGEDILFKHLLDMDQSALTRAVSPVLEGGKGNGIKGFAVHRAIPAMVLATSLG